MSGGALRALGRLPAKVRRDLLSRSPRHLARYARTVLRVLRVSRGEFYVPRPGAEDWRLYGDVQNVAHLLHYEWAARVVASRRAARVLDVACGAGYGSQRLASVAAEVVGADASPRAIAYAASHYGRENLRFLHGRLEELERQLGREPFDAIVSFQTVEHARTEDWVDLFPRLLAPDGILLLTTPTVPQTTRAPGNPHHVVEYAAEDLRALLASRFESVLDGESLPEFELFREAHRRFSPRRLDAPMSPCLCGKRRIRPDAPDARQRRVGQGVR